MRDGYSGAPTLFQDRLRSFIKKNPNSQEAKIAQQLDNKINAVIRMQDRRSAQGRALRELYK